MLIARAARWRETVASLGFSLANLFTCRIASNLSQLIGFTRYHRVITVTRIQPRENNADPLLWQDRRQLFNRELDIEHRRTWPAGDVDGEIGRGRQMGRFWVIAHGRTIEDDHIVFRARLLDYRP